MHNTTTTITPNTDNSELRSRPMSTIPKNSSFALWADYVGVFHIPERMYSPKQVIELTDNLSNAFAKWENAVEAEMTAQNGVRTPFIQFWAGYTSIADFRNRTETHFV